MKTVLILSGGMDSTTLLYDLIDQDIEVYPISFNYGQRHNKELILASKNCERLKLEHKIVDLTSLQSILDNSSLTGDIDVPEGYYKDENMKSTVVPNRNMIMLSIAVGYAINIGSDKVCYGAHAGDHDIYPDCRAEFVDALNGATILCHYEPVYIYAPYLYMDKADIVNRGLELNVPYEDTWTCYKGGERACGVCGSCVERLEAFEKNGVKDPVKYEVN